MDPLKAKPKVKGNNPKTVSFNITPNLPPQSGSSKIPIKISDISTFSTPKSAVCGSGGKTILKRQTQGNDNEMPSTSLSVTRMFPSHQSSLSRRLDWASTPRFSINVKRRRSNSLDSSAFCTSATNCETPSTNTSHSLRDGNVTMMSGKPVSKIRLEEVSRHRDLQKKMAGFVLKFLIKQKCPDKPSHVKELMIPTTITAAKYIAIVKFVASYLVGKAYFRESGDDIDKIMGASKLLKYPGQLSKYILITPNTQHLWPTSLAFVWWLCCRVRALVNPPAERSASLTVTSARFKEHFLKSVLKMLPIYLKKGNVMEGPEFEAELEEFRTRVRKAHGVESDKTLNQLLKTKDEARLKLTKLREELERDPVQVQQEQIDSQKKQLAMLEATISKLENDRCHYENTNHLLAQQESLNLEISTKMTDVEELRKHVESQILSCEDARKIVAETADMEQKLGSIMGLNQQLKMDVDKRKQILANSTKRFYEVCQRFYIVERYNELVQNFSNDLKIPLNPYSPNEMMEWFENASKTLKEAETAVIERKEIWANSLKRENVDGAIQLNKIQMEVDHYNIQLDMLTKETEDASEEEESDRNRNAAKLHDAHLKIEEAKLLFKKKVRVVEDWDAAYKEWQKRLDGFKKMEKEWEAKLEEDFELYLLHEAQSLKAVHDSVSTAFERQEAFYQDLIGVNVFEESLPDPELAEAVCQEESTSIDEYDTSL